MNEKLFITKVDGASVAVLHLNGSAGLLPDPWEGLSDLVNFLGLPDHPESAVQPLEIDPRLIKEILRIENPTPEQEAMLTAVLSGDTAIAVESSVNARRVEFNLGLTTRMAAALVDASAIDRIPTRRLLIITDLPLN